MSDGGGQMTCGLVGHWKFFAFNSERGIKPLEGSEERSLTYTTAVLSGCSVKSKI